MIGRVLAATALAAGALSVAACGAFAVLGTVEQPEFAAVGQIGRSVEIRQYPPMVAIETTLPAGPEARNRSFRLLADYIGGNNRPSRSIAMTAPVEVSGERPITGEAIAMTAPVETRERGDQLTMRFYLPAAITPDTAPEPGDPRVQLVTIPERNLAVLRFSGARDPETLNTRQRLLVASVDGAPDWRVDGAPFAMLYDPPWMPSPLRRNEVAVPVAPAGP